MQKRASRICFAFIGCCLFFSFQASAQFNNYSKEKKRLYKVQNNRTALFTGRKMVYGNVKNYVTLGVSGNVLNYFGDIAPKTNILSTHIGSSRAGLGISSSVRINANVALRAEFMYGQISGSDYKSADPNDAIGQYRYARNLHFRNTIQDLSLVGTYDFFSNPSAVMFRSSFTPYVFGGVSVFHHNPKALVPESAMLYPGAPVQPAEAGTWVALRPLYTEGKENTYSAFQMSIPMGAGVRFRLNQFLDLEAEMSYRYLFTDYIDDISRSYVDKGTLDSELAKIMSDRSLEPVDALTGAIRYQNLNGEFQQNIITYTGADGREYITVAGYGQANEIRGSYKDKDIFLTSTVRLVVIMGKSPFVKNKYR